MAALMEIWWDNKSDPHHQLAFLNPLLQHTKQAILQSLVKETE